MPECIDDPAIPNDERLWRRIAPAQVHREPDGTCVPSSGALRTAEMSVHRASLTTVQEALANYADFSLVEFTAGLARELGLKVYPDPLPEDPSHAIVCPRATGSAAKELARRCTFVVLRPPP